MLYCAARGEPPLALRMPPTLVVGLPPLKPSESSGADSPLWLWSDLEAGGGLRCMRRPIERDAAFVFLVGKEVADLANTAEAAISGQAGGLTREYIAHMERTLGSLVGGRLPP